MNPHFINNPYDSREDRQQVSHDPGSMYVENRSDNRYNFVHHPATELGDGKYLDKDEFDKMHWKRLISDR